MAHFMFAVFGNKVEIKQKKCNGENTGNCSFLKTAQNNYHCPCCVVPPTRDFYSAAMHVPLVITHNGGGPKNYKLSGTPTAVKDHAGVVAEITFKNLQNTDNVLKY